MAGEKSLDLYLIRHGESLMNSEHPELINGRSNESPLSGLGKIQAGKLGMHLAGEEVHFDEVYSSPAVRTIDTARLVCYYVNYPLEKIIVCDELQEQSQGDWEGKSKKQLYTPAVLAAMNSDNWNFKAPNGESQKDVEERMLKWATDELLPRYEQGLAVGVFTHRMSIRCLFRGIMESSPKNTYKIELDNTAITRFKHARNGWHLMVLNDTAHLAGMEKAKDTFWYAR